MERLDKTVASCGNMTRRDAVRLIRAGQVRVDDVPWRDPAQKLDPAAHIVTAAGRTLDCRAHRYILLNKPQGILCVSRDPHAETVIDLLPPQERRRGLFPAGRLDKDTVGLVLLTDDGDFAHRVLAPKKAVFKHYRAVVEGTMPREAIAAFAEGLPLPDDARCLPAELRILSPAAFAEGEGVTETGDAALTHFFRVFSAKYRIPADHETNFVDIAIQEGRYHQIKRMCETVGHKVLWLKRLSIGGLCLPLDLPEGAFRELTANEAAAVFEPVEVVCAK